MTFMRAILQELPLPSIDKSCLKIIYLKIDLNLPGANELKSCLSTSDQSMTDRVVSDSNRRLNYRYWLLPWKPPWKAWPRLNIKMIFPGVVISIIKIRRSWDHLIFMMGIPILVKQHLYIKTAPCGKHQWEHPPNPTDGNASAKYCLE